MPSWKRPQKSPSLLWLWRHTEKTVYEPRKEPSPDTEPAGPLVLSFPASRAMGKNAQSCPTHVTPWTVALQAPLSMRFPRQEYWSEFPFHTSGDLHNPGIQLTSPVSPALQVNSLLLNYQIREALSLHSDLDNPYWYFPSVFIFAAVSNMLLVSSNSLSLAVTSLQLCFHLSIFSLIYWILYHQRNTKSTVLVLSSFTPLFLCQWVTFSCLLACVEVFLIGWCGSLVSKSCPITMTL